MTRAAAHYILNATSIEFTEYGAGGGIYIMFFIVRDGVVTNPRALLQSIRRRVDVLAAGSKYYEVAWYPFTRGLNIDTMEVYLEELDCYIIGGSPRTT